MTLGETINQIIEKINNEIAQGHTWTESRDFLNTTISDLKEAAQEYKTEVDNLNNEIDAERTKVTTLQTNLNKALEDVKDLRAQVAAKSKWEVLADEYKKDLDEWTGAFPDSEFKDKGISPSDIKAEYDEPKITEEIQEKLDNYDDLEEERDGLIIERDDLKVKKLVAEADRDTYKTERDDFETKFNDATKEIKKLKEKETDVATVWAKLNKANEDLKEAKADIVKKEAQAKALRKDIADLKIDLQNVKDENKTEETRLNNEIDKKTKELAIADADIIKLKAKRDELQTEVAKLQDKVIKLDSKHKLELKIKQDELDAETTAKNEAIAQKTQLEKDKKELEEEVKKIPQLELDNENLENDKKGLLKTIASKDKQITSLKADWKNHSKQILALEKDKSDLYFEYTDKIDAANKRLNDYILENKQEQPPK